MGQLAIMYPPKLRSAPSRHTLVCRVGKVQQHAAQVLLAAAFNVAALGPCGLLHCRGSPDHPDDNTALLSSIRR